MSESELIMCDCHLMSATSLEVDALQRECPLPTYITLPATWFAVLDQYTFQALSKLALLKTNEYKGANSLSNDTFRIIHACNDCKSQWTGFLPPHVTVLHYPEGIRASYIKVRKPNSSKGIYEKIYDLAEFTNTGHI